MRGGQTIGLYESVPGSEGEDNDQQKTNDESRKYCDKPKKYSGKTRPAAALFTLYRRRGFTRYWPDVPGQPELYQHTMTTHCRTAADGDGQSLQPAEQAPVST